MSTPQETIKLLVSIVDRERAKYIKKFCEENNIYFSFRLHGQGTASSDLLALIGLDGSEKNLIVSMVPGSQVKKIMKSISRLMNMGSPGRGIAFTIPLAAVNALAANEIHDLLPSNQEELTRKGENLVEFSLILAVYNAGYTDEMVSIARTAGATGGTVLHARGIAKEQGEKFFGLTIQDEKEVMLILSPSELSRNIMDALNKGCGPKTDIRAMVMAVPVHDVAGLG